MIAISGCLGTGLLEGPDDSDDGEASQSGGSSGGSNNEQTATPDESTPEQTPESTPEETSEEPDEQTPEAVESLEDRITFTRDDDDPAVVGTLLMKGPIPGVIVSTDYQSADAWQNYATLDEENGTYKVGLSVTASAAIGRLSVVGTVYDADDDVVSKSTDVSSNIPSDEKALIHLTFDGDVSKMHYFEISLDNPA
ncbi:hypothetical protein C453_12231 [Haloferax elongans ATCC BAA-1513]|uniref:Uncharacterized protein n=1 Tax=Haloferax elongans ATCC BAA-1513 TaxID=1230453 RepID=M0HLV2_HALEO|nr:hypothetical protein [Haloferax elongans]ELZ84783.1 hypothetical protein C453_12231 [Haloferax elongans ATCC BAA-1513]